MKTMKDYVRQMAHPEGSMAEGYMVEESVFLSSHYLKRINPNALKSWRIPTLPESKDLVLGSKSTRMQLQPIVYEQAHKYVLHHTREMLIWEGRYGIAKRSRVSEKEKRMEEDPRNDHVPIEYNTLPSFRQWLYSVVQEASKEQNI